jgi:hypothetical protein
MALYDLQKDLGEKYDVQTAHPEVVQHLMQWQKKQEKSWG